MASEQTSPDVFKITASDGQTIEVSVFHPPRELNNGKLCIIAPALAVPRRFYDIFALYLAAQGFHVLSLDLRGFGGSAKKPLFFDDGFKSFGLDMDAALTKAAEYADEIVFVGHSLGTIALGYASLNSKISRALAVGSGSGYYGWSPFPHDKLRYVFWSAILPALTHIFGFYPGKAIGIMGNIPKPIALTWARMCKIPGYFKGSLVDLPPQHFADYTGPMLSISITDDKIMPRAGIEELCRNFPAAHIVRAHIKPQDAGVARLGHFLPFKIGEERLWPAFARWLNGERFILLRPGPVEQTTAEVLPETAQVAAVETEVPPSAERAESEKL